MMKFICSKQELYEALTNVSRAVAERSTIPSLEGIKFSLMDNTLTLTGYDLEIGIETSIQVETEFEGEAVVNPKLFSEMIRKMPAGDITIDVGDNLAMKITGGSTEYNISSMNAVDYPQLPEFFDDQRVTLPQSLLKAMVSQSVFAVSQVDTRPILKGELFEIENGVLNVVAIDGYRLAVRTEAIKNEKDFKFVVPAKTLNEVSRLLSDSDEDSCTIMISKKQVVFDFSGYTVFSRLLEGEFHNYRSSIPKTSVTEVIIEKRELVNCLERASLLINEKNKAPVRCMFEDGELKLSCQTQLGRIFETIQADTVGPRIELGFNCRYLFEPLRVIEDDKVRLLMNGGNLPMKILPLNGDKYVYLVLPVRLKTD